MANETQTHDAYTEHVEGPLTIGEIGLLLFIVAVVLALVPMKCFHDPDSNSDDVD